MSRPTHTHAAILSTGDELVMGQLADTNARWLAERLTAMGVRVLQTAIVGDDAHMLVATIGRLSGEVPLLVMSGGLGPTDGDLTRQAICDLTGDTMVRDPHAQHALELRMAARGRPVTGRQLRQADRPSRAACIPNAVGTAPGLHVPLPGCDILCLPGPPGELRPMWNSHAAAIVRPDPSRRVLTKLLYAVGLPEADAADRLKALTARGREVTVNLTASGGVLTVRARAEGPDTPHLAEAFEQVIDQACNALEPHVFASLPASDDHSTVLLAAAVIERLAVQRQTLTTVESCTGGMLGQCLTSVAGSSFVYLGGVVTYDNRLKVRLAGVPQEVIDAHGAVSEPAAAAMAAGGLTASPGVDWSVSITGIAGPGGESAGNPVGTVWIGLASRAGTVSCRRFCFPGDRADVRSRACSAALTMLFFAIVQRDPGRLLWEV